MNQGARISNSSITGLASNSAASSAICATAVSSAGPRISSSNLLPWRTPVICPNPRRWQALAIASPCGSWISGLSITSTTTLATSRSVRDLAVLNMEFHFLFLQEQVLVLEVQTFLQCFVQLLHADGLAYKHGSVGLQFIK